MILRRLLTGMVVVLAATGCGGLLKDVPPTPGGQLPGEGNSVVETDKSNGNEPVYPDQSADPSAYESFNPPIVLSPAPESENNPGADERGMPTDPPSMGQMGIQLSQTLVHLPGISQGSVFLGGTTAHVALVAPGSDPKQVEDAVRANLKIAEPRLGELIFYWDQGAVLRFLGANQRLLGGEDYNQVVAGLGLVGR